ncbi:MAG: saccharopine dehydrogenase NADP-binding domain-containing protein [Deltaproteobacteria bacterium]|nr:saccharopine dehydrogenase NADP-binding domain-containing protein [Deltaproteobacteria bacterium]
MPDAAPAVRPRDRSRAYDIVLWGATGFTGRLVAEHLVRHPGDVPLRIALAGRSRDKLEALRTELAAIDPAAADLPLELADSFDKQALDALAAKAEVICTTVGPYLEYGAALVDACVQHGTDYCDLTGEVPFIRQMIDAHHEQAQRSGSRIVCCCGFDSIPSDLGTLMMQQAMHEQHGVSARDVKLAVTASRGGFSGGTVASMIEMVERMRKDQSLRRLMANPYALDPSDEKPGPDSPDQKGVRFDDDLDRWTAPFVMAAVNTRVVRRSNALLGYDYGRDFRYQEFMAFRRGAKGLGSAWSVAGGLVGFLGAVTIKPTRKLLQRFVLPAPGEGPSLEQREAGLFRMRLFARGSGSNGEDVVLRGRVEGNKDPGYGGTAIMLGESARCLALDGATLDSPGGISTPAAAMGSTLIERLRGAGMVFSVDDPKPASA